MSKWNPNLFYESENKKVERINPLHSSKERDFSNSSKSQGQTKWKINNSSDNLITYGEFIDYINKTYRNPSKSRKVFKHILKLHGYRNISYARSNLIEVDIFNAYKKDVDYFHKSFKNKNDFHDLISNRPNYTRISWHFKYHPIRTIIILVILIIIINGLI